MIRHRDGRLPVRSPAPLLARADGVAVHAVSGGRGPLRRPDVPAALPAGRGGVLLSVAQGGPGARACDVAPRGPRRGLARGPRPRRVGSSHGALGRRHRRRRRSTARAPRIRCSRRPSATSGGCASRACRRSGRRWSPRSSASRSTCASPTTSAASSRWRSGRRARIGGRRLRRVPDAGGRGAPDAAAAAALPPLAQQGRGDPRPRPRVRGRRAVRGARSPRCADEAAIETLTGFTASAAGPPRSRCCAVSGARTSFRPAISAWSSTWRWDCSGSSARSRKTEMRRFAERWRRTAGFALVYAYAELPDEKRGEGVERRRRESAESRPPPRRGSASPDLGGKRAVTKTLTIGEGGEDREDRQERALDGEAEHRRIATAGPGCRRARRRAAARALSAAGPSRARGRRRAARRARRRRRRRRASGRRGRGSSRRRAAARRRRSGSRAPGTSRRVRGRRRSTAQAAEIQGTEAFHQAAAIRATRPARIRSAPQRAVRRNPKRTMSRARDRRRDAPTGRRAA